MDLETNERQKEILYNYVKDEVANTKYLSVQLSEAEDRERKSAAFDTVLIRRRIRQNLPTIRPAIRLTAASIMAQLSEFRERVRSDNHLRAEHEQFHDELLATLDQLISDIESLWDAMSNRDEPATEEEVEATASWLESFQSRIETNLVRGGP